MERLFLGEEGEEAFFGPFYPFVKDSDITDVDYDGRRLWLTDISGNRRSGDLRILPTFVDQFSKRVANLVSKSFNKQEPVLEAETDNLRITVVHESVSILGRCVCIRKSNPSLRLTEESIIGDGYCDRQTLDMLINFVKDRKNIVICGEPGAGKTECAKFLSRYIPDNERVITIEDTPEWHYGSLFEGRDCVELRLGEKLGYTEAIKTCLRLNPKWMMLSEARSSEVVYLIEGFSTGIRGFTTIHADDVRKIPDRMINMAKGVRDTDRMENDIYSFINVGVLIKRDLDGRRFISQICTFDRVDGQNNVTMLLDLSNADHSGTGESCDSSVPDMDRIKTVEFGMGGTYAGTKSFVR